jgi:hypothetical protein
MGTGLPTYKPGPDNSSLTSSDLRRLQSQKVPAGAAPPTPPSLRTAATWAHQALCSLPWVDAVPPPETASSPSRPGLHLKAASRSSRPGAARPCLLSDPRRRAGLGRQ